MTEHECPPHQVERRVSSVTSIKEVVFMLTSLAITTGIGILVKAGSEIPVTNILVSKRAFLFLTLAINLVRFAHGNIRLLDDSYIYDTEYERRGGCKNGSRTNRIYLDFAFVILLSMLFSVTAFYLNSPPDFISIFLCVLLVDIIWGALSFNTGAPRRTLATQANWFWNNIFFFVILLVCALIDALRPTKGFDWYIVASFGAIWINTVLDLWLNWDHYFPAHQPVSSDA